MAENTCTGNCLKCSFQQQVYCSAQRTFGIAENQRAIIERLDLLREELAAMTTKNDIIPLTKDSEAQISGGADNRPDEP